MNWGDILERASWTGVQSFLGALATTEVAGAIGEADLDTLQALALSAFGASVAALISFFKTVAQERLAKLDTRKPS